MSKGEEKRGGKTDRVARREPQLSRKNVDKVEEWQIFSREGGRKVTRRSSITGKKNGRVAWGGNLLDAVSYFNKGKWRAHRGGIDKGRRRWGDLISG